MHRKTMEEYKYPSKGIVSKCNRIFSEGDELKVIVASGFTRWLLKGAEKTIVQLNSNEVSGWPFGFIIRMFFAPRFLLICLFALNHEYKLNIFYDHNMYILFTKQGVSGSA
jgi:hypothetical protein